MRHSWVGEALVDEDAALDCDVTKIETSGGLAPVLSAY
jgi:hypothetical protein